MRTEKRSGPSRRPGTSEEAGFARHEVLAVERIALCRETALNGILIAADVEVLRAHHVVVDLAESELDGARLAVDNPGPDVARKIVES